MPALLPETPPVRGPVRSRTLFHEMDINTHQAERRLPEPSRSISHAFNNTFEVWRPESSSSKSTIDSTPINSSNASVSQLTPPSPLVVASELEVAYRFFGQQRKTREHAQTMREFSIMFEDYARLHCGRRPSSGQQCVHGRPVGHVVGDSCLDCQIDCYRQEREGKKSHNEDVRVHTTALPTHKDNDDELRRGVQVVFRVDLPPMLSDGNRKVTWSPPPVGGRVMTPTTSLPAQRGADGIERVGGPEWGMEKMIPKIPRNLLPATLWGNYLRGPQTAWP